MRAMSLRGLDLSSSLTVRDLEASLAWYRDVLGFEATDRHEREGILRAVSMKAGNVRILLGQDDGAKGLDRVKGEGCSMMIRVEDDIDALAQRIQEQGVTLDNPPFDVPWGMRAFRLRDPDGFRITIARDK